MGVTIRDVAEAAGVSKATVSKVLNHSYTISKETTERVNTVIQELGYRPNRRAQSFASKATRTILFLAKMQHGVGFDNPHLFEIMVGVENALSRKGYGLIVKKMGKEELLEQFDELFQSEYVDGAILHASVVSKAAAKRLEECGFPYIIVGDPNFDNCLCWIDTDNRVAGSVAVKHLLRSGYKRIAFVGGPEDDMVSEYRKRGALAALREKVPDGYIRCGQPTSDGGAQAVYELLKMPVPPDALVCANQYIAYGCVNALKTSDIRIPEEMGVITFDDFPFSKVIQPKLSVVNLDMYDMGEQAAKIVLRRVKKPELVVQSQTTLPVLIERQSTARKG